jgi:hypothetical protein
MFVVCFLIDTRPASIPSGDSNDDVAPLPVKGKSKNGSKPPESGDESSDTASEHNSGDASSSDEDLTRMGEETIQRKLMNEVEHFSLLNGIHNY